MGEGKYHADYTTHSSNSGKDEILQSVLDSYEALSYDTRNWVANLANCSSLLWHAYHSMNVDINWSGFYVLNAPKTDELILGPFQGKVACQLIKFGKGVCGNAASSAKTQLVPNVNKYPGHIACDEETQSEIVIPIVFKDQVVGVLDIDCLTSDGFDETDVKYLEQLANLICMTCDW